MEKQQDSGLIIGLLLEISTLSYRGIIRDWGFTSKPQCHHYTLRDHGNSRLTEPKPDVAWHKAIWISRAIPRHSFHAWLVIQNRLPTRDRLISWGLQTVDRCLLCNLNPESRDHLFLSCNYSTDLWNIIATRLQIRFVTTWQDTLDQMLSLPSPVYQRNLTLQAWQSTLYWLWAERNARLHSNTFRSVDQLFKLIDRQLRNKLQSFREENPARSSFMMQSWLRFS